MDDLQARFAREDARRKEDARRFAALDEDECQLCLAHGADKRSLFLSCGYAVHEVVPEAIDLREGEYPFEQEALRKRGYYLSLCKSCRGRLLSHLARWREECLALREVEKDHDGNVQPSDPERCVPMRVNGAIEYWTVAEWEARQQEREGAASPPPRRQTTGDTEDD